MITVFKKRHVFEIIKEKCEKVFRGKYRIFDEDVIYNAMSDICIQYTKNKEKIENLNAWLNAAIHYNYCDYLTQLKKNREGTNIDDVPEVTKSYTIDMLDTIELEELKREVLNLDYPYNKIMYYRIFEDMTHKEIAEKLGIKLLTVRKYYSRTLSMFKEKLGLFVTFFILNGLI